MVILDSSVLVGFLVETDSSHDQATDCLLQFSAEELFIAEPVFSEVLTVLRNKGLHDIANAFLAFVSAQGLQMIFGDEEVLMLAVNFFVRFKKLSFVDCTLMAMAKLERVEMMTFDKALERAWRKVA